MCWVVLAWTRTQCRLGAYFVTRGKPAPDDVVLVCANYRQCATKPVRLSAVNPRELPMCAERKPMDVKIKFRDWPHRWQ